MAPDLKRQVDEAITRYGGKNLLTEGGDRPPFLQPFVDQAGKRLKITRDQERQGALLESGPYQPYSLTVNAEQEYVPSGSEWSNELTAFYPPLPRYAPMDVEWAD